MQELEQIYAAYRDGFTAAAELMLSMKPGATENDAATIPRQTKRTREEATQRIIQILEDYGVLPVDYKMPAAPEIKTTDCEDDYVRIGANIRREMRRAGMTYKDLGRRIGVSRDVIGNILRGRSLTLDRIQKLAKALNVGMSSLI